MTKPVGYQEERTLELDPQSEQSSDEGNREKKAAGVQIATHVVDDQSDPAELELEMVEQLAIANNPAIQQSAANLARARSICKQVGLKPNPTIGYFGEEIGNSSAGGLHGGFVSQTFVRGRKLNWNCHVFNHEVEAMAWQVETQRQRVLTDVRVAFVDALAAQQRLLLAEKFRSVVEKGVTIAEQKLEAEIGTRADVLQSEIQLNEVDLTIDRARFDLSAALKELAALAGVEEFSGRPVGRFENDAAIETSDSLYSEIVTSSPLLAAAQAQVDRARANLHRQMVQPIPNVTAQLGAGGDDSTGDGFANIQLSLPIPINNGNQGNICAAQNELCAAVRNVERLQAKIRRDLAIALRELEKANLTVQRFQTIILPKAEFTVELVEIAYENGEAEFLRVLTARRAFFDAGLQLITAHKTRAQTMINIEGRLLSGGLTNIGNYQVGDELRSQALSGQ